MPSFSPGDTAENLASQLRSLRRSNRARRAESDGSPRELVLVAFAVPAVALAVLAVVVLAVLLMAGSGLTGLGSAVASCWLAIHQVPITISGVSVGLLPMLPTLIVMIATGRLAARAAAPRQSLSEFGAVVGAAVSGPILITAMSLAVLMDGSTVLPVHVPNVLVAFGYTLGIQAVAAVAGVAWAHRRSMIGGRYLSVADRRGLRAGIAATVLLLAAGALLVTARMVQRFGEIATLIETGNDFDGYLGLTLLSVLYLPNLMVGATGVLVGSDAHLGAVSVDLFTVHGGQLPAIPVLGVLPEGPGAGSWGALGLMVPIAAAALVAWRCRDLDPMANVRSVGVAAAVAASLVSVSTAMIGGRLGEFGDAGVTVAAAGVYTLGWIAVIGLVTALIYGVLPSTRAARQAAEDAGWFDENGGFEDEYVIVTDDYEYDADDQYGSDEYDSDDEYSSDEYDGDEYDGDEYDGDDEYSSDYSAADESDQYATSEGGADGRDTADHSSDTERTDTDTYAEYADDDAAADDPRSAEQADDEGSPRGRRHLHRDFDEVNFDGDENDDYEFSGGVHRHRDDD